MASIMQDWTHELPLREQGAIIVGLRGCDVAPKRPYDSPERQLVAYLRWLVMVPADEREVDIPGGFIQSKAPIFKESDIGHYPLHWVTHLMHAYEVIGYRHPNWMIGESAFNIYVEIAQGLHLPYETRSQMIERFSEDRIKNDTVVS